MFDWLIREIQDIRTVVLGGLAMLFIYRYFNRKDAVDEKLHDLEMRITALEAIYNDSQSNIHTRKLPLRFNTSNSKNKIDPPKG